MNDNEFRARYAAAQEKVQASNDLKTRTFALAKNAAATKAPTGTPREHDAKTRPTPRRISSTRTRVVTPALKRWLPTTAACLVAVALVVGALPFVSNFTSGNPTSIALDDAAARSGFSVRAYASDNTTTILPGENGMIVFDRSRETSDSSGDAVDPATNLFTGCLFRVEGEDIARVQMNVSAGELYRQDTEHLTQMNDPERWHEATTWKATKRGLDGAYGDYDLVYLNNELDSPEELKELGDIPLQVQLLKRYGATIDTNAADDPAFATGETSFGLYLDVTDIDDTVTWSSDGTLEDRYSRALGSFEGETLTITVTFDDGRTTTQLIELHTANFRAERAGNGLSVTPELIPLGEQVDYAHYSYSVYGTVTAVNEEDFPLSLENANQYAHEVIPFQGLSRNPETRRVKESSDSDAPDAIIDRAGILGAGQTAQIVSSIGDSSNKAENREVIAITSPSVTRSTTPPENHTLANFSFVAGFQGDIAYANRCSEQVFGYHFNNDGTLTNEDYCFLTASYELTNTTSAALTTDLAGIGPYAIIDDNEGHWSYTHTSYDILQQASNNAQLDIYGRSLTIAAGDTAQIKTTLVVPNWIADSSTLMFPAGRSLEGKPVLFFVADQV